MYQIYLKRQRVDLELFSQDEALDLEPNIDYSAIHCLSTEVKERLSRVRPTNLVRFFPIASHVLDLVVDCPSTGCSEADGRDDASLACCTSPIREEDICPTVKSQGRSCASKFEFRRVARTSSLMRMVQRVDVRRQTRQSHFCDVTILAPVGSGIDCRVRIVLFMAFTSMVGILWECTRKNLTLAGAGQMAGIVCQVIYLTFRL
jgi:hypothetical protein